MIREKIKSRMLGVGMNVYKLAKVCKLQPAQLINYLAGKKELRSDNLESIFKTLDIKLV